MKATPKLAAVAAAAALLAVPAVSSGDHRERGWDRGGRDLDVGLVSTVRDGTTVRVQGSASLTVGGQSGLYKIKLFSGRASSRGSFSSRNLVTAIAIPLNQL